MFTRRQIVIAGAALGPAAGLPALPFLDPIQHEFEQITSHVQALLELPLSVSHRSWATTIRDLVPRGQVAFAPDGVHVRDWRGSLSSIMGYSEFLGLHHPAGGDVKMLTKQITAATARIERILSEMA